MKRRKALIKIMEIILIEVNGYPKDGIEKVAIGCEGSELWQGIDDILEDLIYNIIN